MTRLTQAVFNKNSNRPSLWLYNDHLRIWNPKTGESWYFNNRDMMWTLSYWESPTGGYKACKFVSFI